MSRGNFVELCEEEITDHFVHQGKNLVWEGNYTIPSLKHVVFNVVKLYPLVKQRNNNFLIGLVY
ncbi:unnamed protein product [Meloidogyne enterolobii]|uniref:Uncharacterized protein n=1 Tax=Meloidogyne enterolobii TaxID=390850 RepID=A0ACB1AXP5_MELEN